MKNKYLAGLLMLPALALVSCNQEENSIDDYYLNYEITEVPATSNIPVGCILYNCYGDLNDAGRWERLEEEYDTKVGHIGPNMIPSAGAYKFIGSSLDELDDYSVEIGRMIEEMKIGGIDFVISPGIRETKSLYPNNVNREDSLFLNFVSGREKEYSWSNDGSMKFAMQINMQNFAANLGFQNSSSSLERCPTTEYEYVDPEDGVRKKKVLTGSERFMDYARRLADWMMEDTYYRLSDGRPVLFLREPDKFFVEDPKKFYDDFRSAVMSVTGINPYIICSIPNWDVVPRYQYMMLEGMPDAIVARNMADMRANPDRQFFWDILTNENFKYNREYLAANFPSISFIPSVSMGYSNYVFNTSYRDSNLLPNEADFRKRCWIAKMNLGGGDGMVVIDSFNDWGHANFMEIPDPSTTAGAAMGDCLLKACRSEFKVN